MDARPPPSEDTLGPPSRDRAPAGRRRARRGSSAIEYALLAGLIAVVIVGAMTAVGSNVSTSFYDKVANALS